jgi:hypothetical protein
MEEKTGDSSGVEKTCDGRPMVSERVTVDLVYIIVLLHVIIILLVMTLCLSVGQYKSLPALSYNTMETVCFSKSLEPTQSDYTISQPRISIAVETLHMK